MDYDFKKILIKNFTTVLNEIPIPCQIIVDEGGKWDIKEFNKIWINKATMAMFPEGGLGHFAHKLTDSMLNSLQGQWHQVQKAIRDGSKGFVGPFTSYYVRSDNLIVIHEYQILLLDEIEGGRRFFLKVTTDYKPRNTQKTNPLKNSPNPWAKLSGRELEIVKLISKGFVTKVIADKLSVSERTVDNHRANIRKKLQLPSHTPLAKYLSNHIPQ